ncbi:MAG TPA: iron-sulfur cluster assembly accessory protein [Trueperaceae bacterium]|nr:iron-sulfur cluster assembly accessory protein [Trueperaceae bacterium]
MQAGTLELEQVTFTEAGARRARELLAGSGLPGAAVRIFVKSGGCSGYQYGMKIDDKRLEGDKVFESNGVSVVVDQRSWPLLRGSEVDFVENLMGGGFSVRNPNASSECGCGHSFRTDGAPPPAEGASCS